MLLCVGIGLAVPDFGLACGLVGGVSNTLVGMIMPPLLYIKLSDKNGHVMPQWERMLNWAVVFFGVILMVVSTATTIQAIVKKQKHS